MNSKIRILLLTFLCFTGGSFSAHATGWYVGGGAMTSNLEDDLDDEISQGFGFAVIGGYRATEIIGIELIYSSTVHDEDVSDGYLFNDTFMLGGKFSFGGERFKPYVALGITRNWVDFENFEDITGDGTYWGAGADIFINQNHAINVSYRLNDWDGDDDLFDYDVSNKMLSVAYNFYFTGN